jgi:hypothetical protein
MTESELNDIESRALLHMTPEEREQFAEADQA